VILAKSYLEADENGQKAEKEEQEKEATSMTATLAESLDVYSAASVTAKRLIDVPPDFSAMAVKPIMFDLALVACEFPDLSSRLAAKKGGFWGFWRS